MNQVVMKKVLSPIIKLIEIDSPLIARKAKPGQFIMIRVNDNGERIPLTISDFNREKGTITLIFQEIGKSTKLLGQLEVGDFVLDLVGPLGNPTEINFKNVAVIGGGLGTALIFTQVKQMHANGAKVDVIIGARTKELVMLENEIKPYCESLTIVTDDGTYGQKGFVTNVLKDLIDKGHKYDCVMAVGPLVMMKAVSNLTKEYGIHTIVSMNPIMIDGTGMCGGCRLTVGGVTKFACVDGPEFDGHLVDFDEAIRRTAIYKQEEKQSLEAHECKIGRFTTNA